MNQYNTNNQKSVREKFFLKADIFKYLFIYFVILLLIFKFHYFIYEFIRIIIIEFIELLNCIIFIKT